VVWGGSLPSLLLGIGGTKGWQGQMEGPGGARSQKPGPLRYVVGCLDSVLYPHISPPCGDMQVQDLASGILPLVASLEGFGISWVGSHLSPGFPVCPYLFPV
jgi:hypothetical protein